MKCLIRRAWRVARGILDNEMTDKESKLHYEWKTLLDIYPKLSWSGRSAAKKRIEKIREELRKSNDQNKANLS